MAHVIVSTLFAIKKLVIQGMNEHSFSVLVALLERHTRSQKRCFWTPIVLLEVGDILNICMVKF